jgi:threonine 3-dehydrogenase
VKALVKRSDHQGLRLEEVATPRPGEGEVLVKVLQTGICGTDLQIFDAPRSQPTWEIPSRVVVGHEFAGIVEQAPGGSVFTPGTLVSGEGHLVCGSCALCHKGQRHLCSRPSLTGVTRDGAFAEYVALPEASLWRHTTGTDVDIAALFDPFGNAVHAATLFPVVGQDVLVTGAGPIGLMAIGVVRRMGARTVVVTDISPARQRLATEMGATAVLDPRTDSVGEVCSALGIDNGFSVGLEMSGAPEAFRTIVDYGGPGCQVAALGLPKGSVEIDIRKVITKMITFQGVFGRRIFDTWRAMSGLLAAGLDLTPVVTHRFSHYDHEEAFAVARGAIGGKVLIDWSE